MKGYSSQQLKKAIKENPVESRKEWMMWMMERSGRKNSNNGQWQFWQQNNKPIELLNPEMFYQKLNYIHDNPVKAGFVRKAEDWLYSSAIDFYGSKGLIELAYIS